MSFEYAIYVPALWIAMIYAGLNEKDMALDWLDKTYEERFEVLIFIHIAPPFIPLRGDPRFAELIKKVGLADFI
jgi:hypothetical protein